MMDDVWNKKLNEYRHYQSCFLDLKREIPLLLLDKEFTVTQCWKKFPLKNKCYFIFSSKMQFVVFVFCIKTL